MLWVTLSYFHRDVKIGFIKFSIHRNMIAVPEGYCRSNWQIELEKQIVFFLNQRFRSKIKYGKYKCRQFGEFLLFIL